MADESQFCTSNEMIWEDLELSLIADDNPCTESSSHRIDRSNKTALGQSKMKNDSKKLSQKSVGATVETRSSSRQKPSQKHVGAKISTVSTKETTAKPTSNVSDEILKLLNEIKQTQSEQSSRLESLENGDYFYDDVDDHDYQNQSQLGDLETELEAGDGNKRKLDASPGSDCENNCFSSMSKRFKPSDSVVDKNVDEVLANNINELFKNGMSDDQYTALSKHEMTARPKNCAGLVPVKTNQLVWDIMTPESRSSDRKMQAVETSVIKSAIILTKAVDILANLSNTPNLLATAMPDTIEKLNDSIALLGHANRQINLTRRDYIKADLRPEFSHLCAQSQPFTSFLFGDDVPKLAKEIADCSRIGQKLQNFSQRSFIKNRQWRGRGGRGRYGRGRGRGSYYNASKNYRRGNGPQNLTQKEKTKN